MPFIYLYFMIAGYFIQLGIIFAWHAFAFRSNILLYLTNRHINIRFAANSKYFFFASVFFFVTGSTWEFLEVDNFQFRYYYFFPLGLYLFTLLFFTYGVTQGNFFDFDSVVKRYENFVEDDPEIIVVQDDFIQVVPLKFLRSRDLILPLENGKRYSLTFCLLCNSAHAYILPLVNGKEIEISSNGGSVINGNKALSDRRGKYVWQQLTGKGISGKAKPYPLVELQTTRFLWNQVKNFDNAKFYSGRIHFIQYRVYRLIGNLVARIPWLKMTYRKGDVRLGSKVPVVGVHILGEGTKAYPMQIFNPGKIKIMEDKLGKTSFSLVYNGIDTLGFTELGLELVGDKLVKGEKEWSILGKALEGHDDLCQIPITGHVYWYLWSKFYPDTQLYTD